MIRVEKYMLEWYDNVVFEYAKANSTYLESKQKNDESFESILKLYKDEKKSFEDKNLKELLKIYSEANKSIEKLKQKMKDKEVFLSKDFIETYDALKYFDDLILDDKYLRALIFILLDEINDYAKFTKNRNKYNQSFTKQEEKRKLEKKLNPVNKILVELEPKLGGWNIFNKDYAEDKKLRDSLNEYKNRLIEYYSKMEKHNDTEYYRLKLRLSLEQVYKYFNIMGHKKELDNLIKGVRPSMFKE